MSLVKANSVAKNDGTQETSLIEGLVKAWVNYNNGTGSVRDSFGVASITDNGAGDDTVNYSTAFANAGASVQVTGSNGSSGGYIGLIRDASTLPTASLVRIGTATTSAATEAAYANVTAHGDLA
ncbi:hypothetical protein [Tepidimonas sp.]|uniref:hypothetical protein n=1 Tax=Tepidimonas sp. TaxID=2002775 RepID=UPI00391C0785